MNLGVQVTIRTCLQHHKRKSFYSIWRNSHDVRSISNYTGLIYCLQGKRSESIQDDCRIAGRLVPLLECIDSHLFS